MTARRLTMSALLLVLAGPVPVFASEALSDKHGCDNCHAMDKKLIGPAFKAVAEKYRGKADAPALLAGKVRAGSTGVWGAVAMPALAHVPEEDAKALVAWILKQ
jgi:cytochrome c